ncbi:MAG: gamma-glutamylcyclotransferase [Phycisphaerales bacterium]|jgi:hypothetical protein|nr:gamma-glutamylcyclotransferase [Phycisphaerales bacterium]MBT7171477.1 gamma-glutamylcyclotransferase [Phycisphaerales bacterium]
MPAPNEPFNLFMYGTLVDPLIFRAVLGVKLVLDSTFADGKTAFHPIPAILDGYKKISPDRTYLYAVRDKQHRIQGYLVRDLPADMFESLLHYEGKNYNRRTLKVQTAEGRFPALVFIANPKRIDYTFGHAFRDPLKQEILLDQKIEAAIRETEQDLFHTDEELTRRAIAELAGDAIRDIQRHHFETGGISDFAIRNTLRGNAPLDYDRIRNDPEAQALAPNYLQFVIRQVILNQFEQKIRKEFRYELNHLPNPSGRFHDRIISTLIALRVLNRNRQTLESITMQTVDEFDFPTSHLIDYVRVAISHADNLYDSKAAQTQLSFVRRHMGFGHISLGAELEFSNVGNDVIALGDKKLLADPHYDGFLYFYDFALHKLTWRLGGHIDNHREKIHGTPRRGFFEVALGNLSIEANISKPITSDPWILNQLIHHTRQFYDSLTPHSIHLSLQPRSQHKPDQNRLLPLPILQCLFAIAGDPIIDPETNRLHIRRLTTDEIITREPSPSFLFSEISKRYTSRTDGITSMPGKRPPGTYVQQFRFLRLSPDLNYEVIALALKGIQVALRPGTFLKPDQYKQSSRHRKRFERLLEWGKNPTLISPQDIEDFLKHVEQGLATEKRGAAAHTEAYIAWALNQLERMLRKFNKTVHEFSD